MMPEEMGAGGMGRGDLWPTARRILRQRKWWILAISLAVAIPAMWKAYSTEGTYTSSALVVFPPSADSYAFLQEYVPRNSLIFILMVLRSRSVTEEVVDSLPKASFEELLTHRDARDYAATLQNLFRRLRGQPPPEVSPKQLVMQEIMQARVAFLNRPGGFMEIQASASNPQVALDLVAAYIEALRSRTRAMNRSEGRANREFLETTLANVTNALKETEQALAEFRKQRGIAPGDVITNADLVRLSQLEDTLAEVQLNEKMVQARLASVRGALAQRGQEAARPKSAGPPPEDPLALKVLETRYAKLESRYVGYLERLTEEHPLVKYTKSELDEVRAALEAAHRRQAGQGSAEPGSLVNRSSLVQQAVNLDAEANALQVRRQNIQAQVQGAHARVANLSKDELEHASLQQKVGTYRNMISTLQEKIYTGGIRGQGELQSNVSVFEPPVLASAPSYARPLKLALFGIVLGVLLGVGGAVGLEFLDDAVRAESELEALVGVPVLGSISRMSAPKALSAPKGRLRLPEAGRS